MSKRLQVIFPEDEYNKLKRHAKHARVSLGEWVISALRRISDSESSKSPEEKLRAIRKVSAYLAPVDDTATLKKQIQSGYLK